MIHPSAIVSPDAQLAEGVCVGAFSVIEAGVRLDANVCVDGHCLVRGDTHIGENSKIGWGCVIGADPQDLSFKSETRSGVRIGKNNTLREYVTIHRGSHDDAYTCVGANNFLMTGVSSNHRKW